MNNPPAKPKYRMRHDGWTPERKQRFLDTLGYTGCVKDAARVAGISSVSAYRHRRLHADFAGAWEKALTRAQKGLVAVAYKRAVEGKETIIIRKGEEVERRISPSDAMLGLLLKRGDLSREEESGHADLAGLRRDEILTLDEWRLNIRFDAQRGGKTVEPDWDTMSDRLDVRTEQLRRGLQAMATRGEACPCCRQALPPGWPQVSLMALDTLGVIQRSEVERLVAYEGLIA